jgi:hypothetical protein
MRKVLILAPLLALPAVALLAANPSALAQVSGGLWDISGAPGGPTRACVSDVLKLAQFEHRARNCSRDIVSDKPGMATLSYNCGPGDFGRSEIDVITPRSLRISTQGISSQLPFNYVLQARRVGDCDTAAAPRH